MKKLFLTLIIHSILFIPLIGFASYCWKYTNTAYDVSEFTPGLSKRESLKAKGDNPLKEPFYLSKSPDLLEATISRNINDYARANFRHGSKPRFTVEPPFKLIWNLNFGYKKNEDIRVLGQVAYTVVSPNGQIIEMGFRHPDILKTFLKHLKGYTPGPQELKRLSELNTNLIQSLRKHPQSKIELEKFVESRGWPEGYAEHAQIAYLNPKNFDLYQWARESKYSYYEMYQAGWFKLKFAENGKPFYEVRDEITIKIPYFADHERTKVLRWRSRVVNPEKGAAKYKSYPKDRSLNLPYDVNNFLYNGWDLSTVRGKRLVITEGEFKCLVSTQKTGILHVGIPGITLFDDRMIQAIVDAGPSEVVVIMDRDPLGKAIKGQIDGVTLSSKAAYQFAKDLQRLGAKKVRVGILPDVYQGAKVGADDLILEHEEGLAHYLRVIGQAQTPEKYAESIGLDPLLQEYVIEKTRLKQDMTSYRNARSRGVSALDRNTYQDFYYQLDQGLPGKIREHIRNNYNGAQDHYRPPLEYDYVKLSSKTRGKNFKAQVPNENYNGIIILLDYVTRNLDPVDCTRRPCHSLSKSSDQLMNSFKSWKNSENRTFSLNMREAIGILKEQGFNLNTYEEFQMASLLAEIIKIYPPDDYYYGFNYSLSSPNESAKVPITIFSKKNDIVEAMARLQTDFNQGNQVMNLFNRVESILFGQ